MDMPEMPALTEKQKLDEIVARHRLPRVVDRVSVEFGTDHDGDAASWLVVALRPDAGETRDTFDAVYAFWDEVRPQLWAAGYERIPYMRLERQPSNAQDAQRR